MKRIISFISFILICSLGFAQEQTLLTIDDKVITEGEFVRIYEKNNTVDNKIDNKTAEEYLDLFINFKLKVIEAENQGLDTLAKFKKELRGYKRQLEKPFFTDKKTDERLLNEAFERQQYDVRASHILVLIPENSQPEDTLKAYKKITKIRKSIVDGKISFDKAAQTKSEDPSAKQNKGDLGYFTVFNMVYPFENAAYNTPVGQVSEIVRTRYGYHILKVTDNRKSKGEVRVAHIMVGTPKGADKKSLKIAEDKIDMIYKKLQEGADFKELAQLYSDDKASSQGGGELNWFRSNQMPLSFEAAAFSLEKKGDYSKPIKTQFGYHILKLLDKKLPKTFEESKKGLKRKVEADMRARVSKKAVIDRIKKNYNYRLHKEGLQDFYNNIDTTIFSDKWDKSTLSHLNKILFELNDSAYSQQVFVDFLAKSTSKPRKEHSTGVFIDKMYKTFIEKELKNVERQELANHNLEFKYLLQEYHDGILLFDVTDQMVWSKAIKDSIGLGHFYDVNKKNYSWGQRVEASVYEYKDAKTLKRLKKVLKKQSKKDYSNDDLLTRLNKKDDSAVELIKFDVFEKGQYNIVDNANEKLNFFEKQSKTPLYYTENNKLVFISKIIPDAPKELDEARGQIIADYQDYLEKEWIKELRKKYKVKLNEVVWKQVKSKY